MTTSKYDYWKRRKVPYIKPLPLFGNYYDYIMMREHAPVVTHRICEQFPGAELVGAFYGTQPSLILRDPGLIKTVLTKDFYYFNSREVADYTKREPLTQNMFFTHGDRWRVIRQNLTPLFTSAKMRNMFHLIEKCTRQLEEMLEYETAESPVAEARSLMARYTMDCISSCAFGVETNTMKKTDAVNPFCLIGEQIFENSTNRGVKLFARAMWPSLFYALRNKVFPDEIVHFFKGLLLNVFESRQQKPSNRNDFVDLILNLKRNRYMVGDSIRNLKTGGEERVRLELDDDLMTGQCVLFFAAGYETSATTLSFTLYQMAMNPAVQARVVAEIDGYLQKHDGKVAYECVKELPYVEACVRETLRMYPVLGVITRELVEDYTLPSGVHLDKGLRVHIPIYHLHNSAENFPEPQEYRPERFLGNEKDNIKPFTYLPFGEGPRICIGIRFAWMQIMAGLVTLFSKYRVEAAKETPVDIKFDPTAFVTNPIGKLSLNVIYRISSGKCENVTGTLTTPAVLTSVGRPLTWPDLDTVGPSDLGLGTAPSDRVAKLGNGRAIPEGCTKTNHSGIQRTSLSIRAANLSMYEFHCICNECTLHPSLSPRWPLLGRMREDTPASYHELRRL
ncbi:unnamed protein product, partial [Iphiclides podalirius]